MVECQSLPIALIYVPVKRRGTLRSDLVRDIAESILEVGQQTPILVRRDGERYVLLDGLHRLEACKALGEENIIGTFATVQVDTPRVMPPYEAEIDIIRQKTNQLRELRLAKEATEKPAFTATAATEEQRPAISNGSRRVGQSSRSRVASLVEWLAERKSDGSPI
ncbi:MAG TPA: ParB N-terminal domain-containing protein [Xanthobacteraceae bacterium]|nr:ParB N-terminal domain-containing protein [Xanthobacteraceae bacterium]